MDNTAIKLKVGENIRAMRLEMGLSQEELADFSSLHRTYIGSVERGERNVSIENIVAIARALKTLPETLLNGIK